MQAISLHNSFTKGATSVFHKLEHQRRRHSSYMEDAKLDEKDDNDAKAAEYCRKLTVVLTDAQKNQREAEELQNAQSNGTS